MSLRPAILISHAVAAAKVGMAAEIQVFAGITVAALVYTTWMVTPRKASEVKSLCRDLAMENGITKEDWEDKVAAVFKVASNLQTHMGADPLLLAVRDADDESKALTAMVDLFTVKGVTCRHYFKQWSKQDNCNTFDPEAANRARKAKEAAARQVMLNLASDIDASSEATRAAAERIQSDALATVEALTPLQRFTLQVADIADAGLIDAMFAVLNARSDELRSIANEAVAAASEPKGLPNHGVKPVRKARAKAA